MIRKKLLGAVVIVLFLVSITGIASATDLPQWVLAPEDSTFSDVTYFLPLDNLDTTTNTTVEYAAGSLQNAVVYRNVTAGYPKLVAGQIGSAFEFGAPAAYVDTGISDSALSGAFSIVVWVKLNSLANGGIVGSSNIEGVGYDKGFALYVYNTRVIFRVADSTSTARTLSTSIPTGQWVMITAIFNGTAIKLYKNLDLVAAVACNGYTPRAVNIQIGRAIPDWSAPWYLDGTVDEVRIYNGTVISEQEMKVLYYVGRKKFLGNANFVQLSSPFVDLTVNSGSFTWRMQVSTNLTGYIPVPEVATNLSVTTAQKLINDYTGTDFYYQGNFWYAASSIQYTIPLQFEVLREESTFSKRILLDKDRITLVYHREFKITNPASTSVNVVYMVDPVKLGFAAMQYPRFELDGIEMSEYRPDNSSSTYLIRTDTLAPGEVATHVLSASVTLSKSELDFPARLEDFKEITSFEKAKQLAENLAKGKAETYVKVVKIKSTADLGNITVLVPLEVKDTSDVIEAVALTGSRSKLQIERLQDGKVVVDVPGDAFVSGYAEVKILYNKDSGSWFKRILDEIHSLMKKILSLFGLGGG